MVDATIRRVMSREVLDEIYQTIDEVNRQLPGGARLEKSEGTRLVGDGGVLDSLGLVTLLVGIEEAMQSRLGIQINLLEEDALADSSGPYQTVGGLLDWIMAKIEQPNHCNKHVQP